MIVSEQIVMHRICKTKVRTYNTKNLYWFTLSQELHLVLPHTKVISTKTEILLQYIHQTVLEDYKC